VDLSLTRVYLFTLLILNFQPVSRGKNRPSVKADTEVLYVDIHEFLYLSLFDRNIMFVRCGELVVYISEERI